ncbi:MAG: CpaD family pilus assembly lipoprotein [Pseudomonadota bacterium]
MTKTTSKTQTSNRLRLLISAGLVCATALALGACTTGEASKTGYHAIAPAKRNDVEMVRLHHDVSFLDDRSGEISGPEYESMFGFLTLQQVGFQDRVFLDDPNDNGRSSRLKTMRKALGNYGIVLEADGPPIGKAPPAGTVRLVIERHLVRAPSCPNWSQPANRTFQNAQSSNFGCAAVTNIGQMVANPQELVRGQDTRTSNPVQSTRAVGLNNTRQLTGAQRLQNSNTGGGGGGGQ